MVDEQVTRFRVFIKYHEKTFDEMLFEMKRVIYKNEMEERQQDEDHSNDSEN